MNYPATINPVTSPASSFWQKLYGTKPAGLYTYIRNNAGTRYEVNYTNGVGGTNWWYNMPLVAGDNLIEVETAILQNPDTVDSVPARATIYLASLTPELYSLWNAFDEFGLLLGLPRLKGETNKAFKARLLDVYINPGNSTRDGLKNAIARELGIATTGVTIQRLSDLADPSGSSNILNSDGNAIGTRLEDYVKEVYDNNPVFWGNLVSDESRWDAIDEEYSGTSYLPHVWDPTASGVYEKWQKSGIGDNDDLYTNKVHSETNITASGVHPVASGVAWRLPVHAGYFYTHGPNVYWDLQHDHLAHYQLNDDNATAVVLDRVTGATGTATQNTHIMSTAGQVCRALTFNGSSDYVEVPAMAASGVTSFYSKMEMSITAWIRPASDGEGNFGRFIDKSDQIPTANGVGYTAYVSDETANGLKVVAVFKYTGINSRAETSDRISINDWHNISIVHNEDGDKRTKIYINGSLATLGIDNAGTLVPGKDLSIPLRIGNHASAATRTFDGEIEDVRILRKALTSREVLGLYNEGRGTYSWLGYYR